MPTQLEIVAARAFSWSPVRSLVEQLRNAERRAHVKYIGGLVDGIVTAVWHQVVRQLQDLYPY